MHVPSHEVSEVEDIVDYVWVLLDDVSERFGINKSDRKLFV